MSQKLSVGRIVLYVLCDSDVQQINRRRTNGERIRKMMSEGKWPEGAQAHIGNPVAVSEIFPAVVIRAWTETNGNMKVLLDGNDELWATSIDEGAEAEPGTWHWPVRE